MILAKHKPRGYALHVFWAPNRPFYTAAYLKLVKDLCRNKRYIFKNAVFSNVNANSTTTLVKSVNSEQFRDVVVEFSQVSEIAIVKMSILLEFASFLSLRRALFRSEQGLKWMIISPKTRSFVPII